MSDGQRRMTGMSWGASGLALGIIATLAVTIFDDRPDVRPAPTSPPAATATDPTPPLATDSETDLALPTEAVDPDEEWLPTDDVAGVLAHGDYPGQPDPGTVLWGSSVPRNGDPGPRHEDPAGQVLGVRRSFFQWDHRTDWLPETVRADLAAGRLPWASIKPPPWEDVARGDHDEEIDEMLEALRDLRGPIWLTVNHEPDGGGRGGNVFDDPGGPSAHVAMNTRVRERMDTLGIDNVALLPAMQAYTFNPTSNRDPDQWWAPGIYDLFGVDIYTRTGTPAEQAVWTEIRSWAQERGVDVAVGEWGLLDDGDDPAVAMEEWYEAAASFEDDPELARVVALAYWDNESQSSDGWRLDGERLDTFQDLMAAPTSATWPDVVD